MRKIILYFTLLFTIVLIPIIGFSENLGDKASVTKIYRQAEDELKKHNYKEALVYYRLLLNQKTEKNFEKKIHFKILETLKLLKHWDELTDEFDNYLKRFPDNLSQARAYNFGALMYQEIPHEAYKRNGKIFRDIDTREGDYAYLYDEDYKKSMEYFQKSKALYYEQKPSEEVNKEIISLNFTFADFLQFSRYYYGYNIEQKESVTEKTYNPDWDINKKIVFLYDEIREMNKLVKDSHNDAKSLFKKASYFVIKNGSAFDYAIEANKTQKDENPIPLLWEVVKNFPKDTLAPEALFGIAEIYSEKSELVTALEIYESLIKKYPQSIRVSDSKSEIQQIKKKELSVSVPGVQGSGVKPKINISIKNIKDVSIKVYSIDFLDSVRKNIDRSDIYFNNLQQLLGQKIEDVRKQYKEKVTEFKITTADKGNFIQFGKEVELPVLQPGFYAVEVKGSAKNTAVSFLIISDITIVKNIDSKKAVIYVLNRETGKPVYNAGIIVREHYYENGSKVNFKEGKTDENGTFVYVKSKDQNNSSYLNVISWKDKQIIYSDANYYYGYYYGQTKTYKSYIYTDRPVYRPEQTVYFKNVLRLYENGELKNSANEKVKVKITNPKGSTVYEKELTANSFGTINDSFQLKKGADLGVYYINTTVGNGNTGVSQSEGQNFRVEEYKKPEYVVTVTSENNQLKPGDKTKVKINAKYYFGSPVAEAKAHYRIVRSPFYYYYYKAGRYDWLYGNYYGRIYNDPYSANGAVWKEGDLVTDAEGNAFVEFETEKVTQDYKYDILVDVVDKSRRSIKGAGSIKVTQTSFYAFVETEQGFYSPGENVGIEINLRNPDEQPVKNSGNLKIYKVTYSGKLSEKQEDKEIFSKKLTSNDEGRIFYKWKANQEGYFKITFETLDEKEKLITGSNYVWITGSNFNGNRFKFKNIELLTDKRTYEEGETARIMVNTNYSDSFVMLFTESDNSILGYRSFYVPNKSKLLEIKIGKQHIPNFNIKAVMIRNSQLFMENREIFVPPSDQFLNVNITTKKGSYLPGEKAFINLRTTNDKGKAVSAEVSLSVTDSSVYYIQEDVSGDIKKYFYGNRRNIQNNLHSFLNIYLYNYAEDTENYVDYKRHRHPFQNGYNLKDSPSAEGLEMDEAIPSKSSSGRKMGMAEAPAPAPSQVREKKGDLQKSKNGFNTQAKMEVSKDNKLKEAEIRSYFPDTALWKPTVVTDSNGKANVEIKFPDSITTWRTTANAIDMKSRVGNSNENIITRKNLMVRLQAPRFFVERDEIILSGIINNDLNKAKKVQCSLILSNELGIENNKPIYLDIPAKSEKRVDWKVKVKKEGTAQITLKGLTDEESDAVKISFPVYIHGIEKSVWQNGVMKNENKKELNLVVPAERKKDSAKLTLTLSSSVLSSVIEALPYLAVYPYGCVEQTTSRFIPTVLVGKTMKNIGVDFAKLQKAPENLNAQELAKWLDKKNSNPVYNNEAINDMVKVGLDRLYKFQNSDGGWGWWNGFRSDSYMSSYVLHGLILAKQSDYPVDNNVIEKGLNFLSGRFSENDEEYNRIFIAYVLSMEKKINSEQLEPFFKKRENLNYYGKALLSLAYANIGNKERADLICQNLKSFVKIDKENGTASWKNDERWYWYWYGDSIETNAYILKAFLKNRPNDEVVPMMAKWLLINRKGNHWYSTKDTANVIYALSEYARITKELAPDYTISVLFNGTPVKKVKVNKDNMFTFDNKIILTDKELKDGNGKITLVKEGKGTLYFSSTLEYFTLEEDIKASGNEISVKREYFKVTQKKDENNNITDDKKLVSYNETLKSGDIVEVKLTIKANNQYEYLIFEDMKPSGFEVTELKSGYSYQNGVSMYREFRDEKVAFFIDYFPQGTQVITYRLRAEIPGKFHVLPHKSYAMYAPQVKAISDEMRIGAED